MRNSDLGLLPASNHATSSSRDSIGVMSTWSRAMQRFRPERAATLHGRRAGGQMGHAGHMVEEGPQTARSRVTLEKMIPAFAETASTALAGSRVLQHPAHAHDLGPDQLAELIRRGRGEHPPL